LIEIFYQRRSLSLAENWYYSKDAKLLKDTTMKVSSAEFIKNYGTLADKALQEAVTITRNGRDRLVLISSEEYGRLRESYRRALRIEDLTEEEIQLISKAEVPAEYAYLDELIKDWKPEE